MLINTIGGKNIYNLTISCSGSNVWTSSQTITT